MIQILSGFANYYQLCRPFSFSIVFAVNPFLSATLGFHFLPISRYSHACAFPGESAPSINSSHKFCYFTRTISRHASPNRWLLASTLLILFVCSSLVAKASSSYILKESFGISLQSLQALYFFNRVYLGLLPI